MDTNINEETKVFRSLINKKETEKDMLQKEIYSLREQVRLLEQRKEWNQLQLVEQWLGCKLPATNVSYEIVIGEYQDPYFDLMFTHRSWNFDKKDLETLINLPHFEYMRSEGERSKYEVEDFDDRYCANLRFRYVISPEFHEEWNQWKQDQRYQEK